jgi:hypothetical protein
MKYIVENAEIYTVQYEVEADSLEDAKDKFASAVDTKEIDFWYKTDLKAFSDELTAKQQLALIEPTIYEADK